MLVLCTLAGCARNGKATTATKGQAVGVEVAAPLRRDIVRKFRSVATLTPWEEVVVYAKTSGYLSTIAVDVGDRVRAGDVLATLEIPEMDDRIAAAKAEATKKQQTLTRLLAIQRQEKDAVAQQEIDIARADLDAARARQDELEAEAAYARIQAPFSGVISERHMDPGSLVTAGTGSKPTAIVKLVNDAKLRAVVAVPETDFRFAKPGNAADLRLDAYPGKVFRGKVSRRAGTLDPSTRTMHTEVLLDNSDHELAAGMYAHIAVNLETRKDALSVKPEWLHNKKQRYYLFVADGDKARLIDVVPGADDGRSIEIVKGLDGNEPIITASTSALRDGARIQVRPQTNNH